MTLVNKMTGDFRIDYLFIEVSPAIAKIISLNVICKIKRLYRCQNVQVSSHKTELPVITPSGL